LDLRNRLYLRLRPVCPSVDVYVRNMRYVVESASTVLFWLVPIFYSFSMVRQEYKVIYQFNPLAALVLALRNVILETKAPPTPLLIKLSLSSVSMFGLGSYAFRRMSRRFYDHF
jgi:ABC-type polysaccharide/polyol phosphate export permease